MLFRITLDRVGCTDPCGSPPNHVVVPCARQLFFQGQTQLPLPQITNHGFNRRHGFLPLFHRGVIIEQRIMWHRTRLHHVRTCLGRKRILTRLDHQMRDVKIKRGFTNFATFDAVEFGIA